MELVEDAGQTARLHVGNVGGIEETDVAFEPGVTVLSGRNASNRTSLLQAIMAVLGSDRASLKGDADAGRVELELGDESYSRTLEREGGAVVFGGDPYASDPDPADVFAFLLESNEARLAVARGDDLRDIIMRPVDTEAVTAEIERLEERQREIQSRLDDRERLRERAADLERERDDIEAELEETRSAYEQTQTEVEEADAELDRSRERKAELESKLGALQEKRSALETVRYRLGTENETAESLREELAEVEEALEEHSSVADEELETLAERIEERRARKRRLDSKINQLQSLVQFNEEMLDEEGVADLDALGSDGDDGHVTNRLVESESRVCWTCGQEATREHIEQTLEELRESRQALVEERRRVTTALEEAQERQEELRERERRQSELERRREELEAELDDAESEIESLTERRSELRAELESIEETVETLREDEYDEIVELHREANELELEVGQLESDLAETATELAETRERLDELDELEAELSDVQDRLAEARTRIERLENEAIAAFNDHMETVLDALEYDNVERIWIERTEREVREGRRKVTRGFFDLHVVRSTADGTVYEDTVAHLSESEREVTGLVFALAGYLVHDVHESMPFMLLDSVEAIDSERIAALVEYLSDYPQYLVVALLPEDAAAVDDDYPEITDI